MEEREIIYPTCRYNHGHLTLVKDEKGAIMLYSALGIEIKNEIISPANRGYAFVIYECPKCSYIEMHDERHIPRIQME